MLFTSRAKEEFDARDAISAKMADFVRECADIYAGEPYWVDDEEHIGTINFAKAVCSETARLATLALGVTIDGSPRAEWLQEQIDKFYFNLRHWTEYGCAFGTIILKPNGDSVDLFTPDRFMVTEETNDEITGACFESQQYDNEQDKWFTRLEFHRFLPNGRYAVSNRCYMADKKDGKGKEVDIDRTPWAGLLEDVEVDGVEKPLFGVFRTPEANNIDISSPLGMPIFAGAIQELEDLDIAYSRNAKEILDSKRTVLIDSDRLLPNAGRVINTVGGYRAAAEAMGLPDYVKAIDGTGDGDVYHEINPTLNTSVRLEGLNAILSQIGYKCGYSNGYFTFNEKTGMVTATQVESDDRRTIQLIKDVRDKLESCLDGLIYALDKFADLYDLAPLGEYEVTYDFGDPTYNEDEDRNRWWTYVMAGKVPFWMFLNKFEGYSEDEAKGIEAAAQPVETLYGEEE